MGATEASWVDGSVMEASGTTPLFVSGHTAVLGFAASLTRRGLDEYHLSTVPIAIGAGRIPFADLDEHLKLDVLGEQRFRSGAFAQILVPSR
jgi:hypothetical protein